MQRPVALKVLAPRYALSERYSQKFFQEAQAAGVINHPNVISCYNVGEDKGLLYMVMELMSGGDLKNLIESRPRHRVPAKRAMQILVDCARGLEAIERAGIIHRDLKPSNIFIAENGLAKIADLGLVLAEDTKDSGNAPVGTPLFMSPEQAQCAPDLDIRTDIYALGVTLFLMLTGRYPYNGQTESEIIAKVIKAPMPDIRKMLPDISENLAALVRKAMAKNRIARFGSATEFREAAEAILDSADFGDEISSSSRIVVRPGEEPTDDEDTRLVESPPPDVVAADIPVDSALFEMKGAPDAPVSAEVGNETCPSCGGAVYCNAGVCMCGYNLDAWRKSLLPPEPEKKPESSDSNMFRKPKPKPKPVEEEKGWFGKIIKKIKEG
jgi:serine/threonine protein kinase